MSERVLKYLWLRDERRQPMACIAYSAEKGNPRIAVGYSVVNPRDELNKELGRTIAKGRHDKKPFGFNSNGVNAVELRYDVLQYLRERTDTPPLLRRALELDAASPTVRAPAD